MSQWSTPSSGPLAGAESLEKGETGEKAVSQWTTLLSGPLAGPERREKCRNRVESREPVDHFVEWTTSSGVKAKPLG